MQIQIIKYFNMYIISFSFFRMDFEEIFLKIKIIRYKLEINFDIVQVDYIYPSSTVFQTI